MWPSFRALTRRVECRTHIYLSFFDRNVDNSAIKGILANQRLKFCAPMFISHANILNNLISDEKSFYLLDNLYMTVIHFSQFFLIFLALDCPISHQCIRWFKPASDALTGEINLRIVIVVTSLSSFTWTKNVKSSNNTRITKELVYSHC